MALPIVYVHDAAFRRIGQLPTAHRVARSYELGGAGLAEVSVARTDPLIEEALTFGNVLVMESDVYPYPWVGAISRDLGGRDGAVRFQCAGYNAILEERQLPTSYTTSLNAGEELRRVIETVNRINATGIGIGRIQNHGELTKGLEFPNAIVSQAMDEIAEAGGLEWWLEFAASPSNIEIRLRVGRARGFDRFRDFTLLDQRNATFGDWMRDRSAQVFALNVIAGQTSVTEKFTERSRVTQIVESGGGFVTERVPVTGSSEVVNVGGGRKRKDSAISSPHGFVAFDEVLVESPVTRKERTVIVETVKTQDVAVQVAQALIERRQIPERTLRVDALDTSEWKQITPGDIVRAVYPDGFVTGWDGPVRVLGTQPREHEGVMNVVVELMREVR